MKQILLNTRIREGSGKKAVHKVRATGDIPGILYGHKEEPISLIVPEHDLWQILHHATSEHLILKLKVEDSTEGEVLTLVRDVQHHPVTGDILHIDFQRISMDEKIKVGVPIELNGSARGVKEFGGVLDHGVREVNIKCTPEEIPESLPIDVSEMDIGDSIHLSEITMHYPQLEFLRLSLHKSLTSRQKDIRTEELKYWQDVITLLKEKRKFLDEYKSLLSTKKRLVE